MGRVQKKTSTPLTPRHVDASTRSPKDSASPKERVFFSAMAVLLIGIVVVGFAPTYYLRGAIPLESHVLPLTPLAHVHGVLFSCWALLFVSQTLLVSAGQTHIHRRLGYLGLGLLPLMIIVATITALHGALRSAGPPDIPPLQFLAISLLDVPVFGLLIGLALWKRHKVATHKRLMLIAMIGMLGPALSRVPVPAGVPQPAFILLAFSLLLLALAAWDISSQGKLNRATVGAGSFLLASLFARGAVMSSEGWLSFARQVTSLAA